MALEVTPVRSRRDRRAFIELPFRLHANAAQWIPPLRLERKLFLSPRFNAWFKHGDAQLFLARRDGRVVGRISAHIDHNFNAYQRNDWGMFGFLELEDDPGVASALLDAAAGWLRSRGRDRMIGPMDFTMNDESGILIEGFEREPFIRQPWHPPYYQRLCEGSGLQKAVDLWMWELHIEDRSKIVPGIVELAAKLEPEHGIRIRKMQRRKLRKEVDLFGETYNEAWKDNWGFVPLSKEDLDDYAVNLQLVFDRNWFMIAEKVDTGESVGIACTVPDANQLLKGTNGRLLRFLPRYLRRGQIIDRVRVGFLGVKPEYQHTGVAAGLYMEHFDMAEATRQTWGEMGWILETNEAMNRGMEGMGGKVVKRYRVYERAL
ncbi:MAG TPA: GNAT family N-acetyltransferase [Thermoleophilaceae bacterium]|nr:GNAT family N-acetyltransferase [Thermoleophilaceae bacterium]